MFGLSYLPDDVRELNDLVRVTEELRDGDAVFRDGSLVRMDMPGGYFTFGESADTYLQGYYYVTDHLGSVRTTANATDSCRVVQQLEYTSSGSIWRSYDRHPLQPKRFCGKEEINMPCSL